MIKAAIIAEYNPFHNGHKFLVDSAKMLGADSVMAIMSGNWVERGDTAIISKFARTHQALNCGVNLVVELPTYYAMSTAQKFAEAAIKIIESLGANMLVFGSECGNIERIMRTVYCVRSGEFSHRVRQLLDQGLTLAKSRETAVEEICGNGELLRSPNDTLAIEYISAAKSLNSKMRFYAVRRTGVDHDSSEICGNICSATALRSMILNGNLTEAQKYMPDAAFNILKTEYENGKISDLTRLEKTILSSLRTLSPEGYKALPDISEGIENRLFNAARISSSFDSLMNNAATKRYTNARLRRLILSAFLKIKAADIPKTVPYIRVLGCDKLGADILTEARGKTNIPIIMRSTSLKGVPCFDFEALATDVYALSQTEPSPCGEEFTNGIIIKR